MARVQFEVRYQFDVPARAVWDEMIDWNGHAEWIPMTRMDVAPGDPTAVGAEFTATTGIGRFGLVDRMRVTMCTWSDDEGSGECEVEKLGPVLRGTAGFTVTPGDEGSAVLWVEDVVLPYTPQFLAPLIGRMGAAGFRQGMRKLARLLSAR